MLPNPNSLRSCRPELRRCMPRSLHNCSPQSTEKGKAWERKAQLFFCRIEGAFGEQPVLRRNVASSSTHQPQLARTMAKSPNWMPLYRSSRRVSIPCRSRLFSFLKLLTVILTKIVRLPVNIDFERKPSADEQLNPVKYRKVTADCVLAASGN